MVRRPISKAQRWQIIGKTVLTSLHFHRTSLLLEIVILTCQKHQCLSMLIVNDDLDWRVVQRLVTWILNLTNNLLSVNTLRYWVIRIKILNSHGFCFSLTCFRGPMTHIWFNAKTVKYYKYTQRLKLSTL
jgi:hypothetical protein